MMMIDGVLIPGITRGAEGFDRRAFTTEDFDRLIDCDIVSIKERLDLVDGDFVPRQPKYVPQARIESFLYRTLNDARPSEVFVVSGVFLDLAARTRLRPDLTVYRLREPEFRLPRAEEVELVIEIADRIDFDLGIEARLFASFGLPEYWVVDPETRRTHIHTGPSENGWESIVVREADEELTFAGLPGWKVRLKDL